MTIFFLLCHNRTVACFRNPVFAALGTVAWRCGAHNDDASPRRPRRRRRRRQPEQGWWSQEPVYEEDWVDRRRQG